MASSGLGDVVRLMTVVLGSVFSGDTWSTWRAVLKAAHALPLTDDERAIVTELTKREVLPPAAVRELWLLLGRRSGKSIIAALLAVWATCCQTYALAPGEVGTFVVVAADRKQARIIKRYISGLLRAHPSLAVLVASETADAIWLTSGLVVEIHTCSWKTLRGYTCIGASVDEVAFWDSEGSNPDHEVLVALRAAMASVPTAMLIALTSVYARRGEVFRMFSKHFGRDESADVLILNGSTQLMNPTIDEATIAAAYEDDPAAAAAEYGAQFRQDVESLLSLELVNEAVVHGRDVLPPMGQFRYCWFFDGASGSSKGGDATAHAIAHREGDRVVVDLVECVWPPFDPATVVRRFVDRARPYFLREIVGDAWAGEWPRAAFEGMGIRYRVAEKPKGELYRELLPLFSSRRIGLPDDPVLTKQLLGLERRTSRSGREIVDHGAYRGAHDDLSNVVAGAAFELREQHLGATAAVIYPGNGAQSSDQSWRLRHFGLAPRRRTLLDGLMNAPRPPHTSQAMLDCRSEEAAIVAEQQRRDRESAAHVERLKAEEAARQQQQTDADAKAALASLPPDLRAKARRRFGLPKELGE